MPAAAPITVWHWAAFIAGLLIFVALDLGAFHRANRSVTTKDALTWTAIWLFLAMVFARVLAVWRGPDESLEFVTGYFVEFSLSMDNVAAMAVLFAFFGVAAPHQHRVLFWGILGALVMRGLMIAAGTTLIQRYHWVLYLMGAFLIFTGIKWLFMTSAIVQPENNHVLKLARKIFPVSNEYNGANFLTWSNGRRALTPLALVLLMVETTDLLFAFDSVPAVFAVTQKPFLVFTSNMFAILGLRSLYFAVAEAIRRFRFLKAGLALILIFVGAKMLAVHWLNVPTGLSLAIVAGLMALSIGVSILSARRETEK